MRTLDSFKKSNFFIKYKFTTESYAVGERNFIDFYQKETLDKVMLEFDSKPLKIIKQIGYLKEKEKIDELIIDFISEAVDGKVVILGQLIIQEGKLILLN